MICPECGSEMLLKETKKFLTKSGEPKKFYGCSRFPLCNSTHGAHPNGSPLGTPATQEVKDLRIKVHGLCDQIWGDWKVISREKKREIYDWMKKNAPKEHIAEMDKNDLLETERVLMLKISGDTEKP
jgi:ssDNA-binding Zn-finger/Zn-ribbon topoisomerase 1